MRRIPPALLLLLLLAVPLAAAAQVYTWTDAHGTPHFSDAPPPPGIHYTIVKPLLGTAHSTPAAEPAPTADTTDATDNDASATLPVRDTPENRAKLCAQLTTNLALLGGDKPVTMTDAQGKPQLMTAEQRQQQTARAEAQLKQYCG
jgi:hypothetical protein